MASVDSAASTRSTRRALSLVVRFRNVSMEPVPASRSVRSNRSAGSTPRRWATACAFGSVAGCLSTRARTCIPHAPSELACRARFGISYVALAAPPGGALYRRTMMAWLPPLRKKSRTA